MSNEPLPLLPIQGVRKRAVCGELAAVRGGVEFGHNIKSSTTLVTKAAPLVDSINYFCREQKCSVAFRLERRLTLSLTCVPARTRCPRKRAKVADARWRVGEGGVLHAGPVRVEAGVDAVFPRDARKNPVVRERLVWTRAPWAARVTQEDSDVLETLIRD